jgi:hypothetical protein
MADGHFSQAIDDHARRVRLPPWLSVQHGSLRAFEFEWREQPTPLSEEFIEDFLALCHACQRAELRLLPSLLSFEWFQPALHKDKGVYAGGRRRLILGPPGACDLAGHVRAFLQATLVPLIERTTQRFGPATRMAGSRHPIFAWESINEPDWVTEGGPRLLLAGQPALRAHETSAILAEFRRVVLEAGYDHSIGFKQFSPKWLDPALRRALASDGERYWHQGHHYPTAGSARFIDEVNATLPLRSREFQHCLVGELPTARGPRAQDPSSFLQPINWTWRDPELARSEAMDERYLEERLRLIFERGYDGAFFWSARPHVSDRRSRWDATTQRQIQRFVHMLAAARVPSA